MKKCKRGKGMRFTAKEGRNRLDRPNEPYPKAAVYVPISEYRPQRIAEIMSQASGCSIEFAWRLLSIPDIGRFE